MQYRFIVALTAFVAVFTACSGKSEQVQKNKAKESQTTVVKEKAKGDRTMKVTEMTKEIFKDKVMDYENNPQEWNFKGDKPAIIDFYATWCGPCKMTAPNVEKIAEEYDGKIDVYKVDVDQQEELAAMFGIQSIPTILFIPKDGTPAKSVGAMGYGQLKDAVNQVLFKE